MERRPTAPTVKTPAENFTGDVYMNPIFGGFGRELSSQLLDRGANRSAKRSRPSASRPGPKDGAVA